MGHCEVCSAASRCVISGREAPAAVPPVVDVCSSNEQQPIVALSQTGYCSCLPTLSIEMYMTMAIIMRVTQPSRQILSVWHVQQHKW